MPFFIDGNPSPSEVSEAVNYLLSNFTQTTTSSISTGQVTTPGGRVQGYLYRYLAVKYADSFDGTLNFSNTPTNRLYYGLRNTDTATPESTNPADYIWYQVTGGFSTTKLLYYTVTGGRQINVIAALAAPSTLWQSDTGTAIDLDIISGSDGASSRNCYAKSTSTSLASTPSTYQTTGNLSFPPTNTWGGSEVWQATPPTLAVNEALFQSDGVYNPTTDLTTWNVPYLSNLKVGSLSAISANMGTLTAGEIIVGSSPTISGTTMTGAGTHLYSDGRFIMGNSSTNITFNGTTASLNGFAVQTAGSSSNVTVTNPTTIFTFTTSQAGYVMYSISGNMFAGWPNNSAAYGVDTELLIYLRNSANTDVKTSRRYCSGSIERLDWNMTPGIYLGALGSPFSVTQVVSLPADTYRIILDGNSYVRDNTGNVLYGPSAASTDCANLEYFYYQVKV
jgi:hypothetical protein